MQIKVKLHPASSQEKIIEKIKDKEYEVWIKTKPIEGKANEELVKALKKYFRKSVNIVKGFTSREKGVEII